MSNSRKYTFLFSVIILGNSVSYFLEMIMLISYVDMLTVGVDTITFHKRRSIRSQHVLLMDKSRNVYTFYFHLLFLVTQSLIQLK